jgi:hypothetical protein
MPRTTRRWVRIIFPTTIRRSIDSSCAVGLPSRWGGVGARMRRNAQGRDPTAPGKRTEAMNPVFRQSLSRCLRSCGAVVVIAVWALGTFQSAHASCGDWLDGHDLPSPAPVVAAGDAAGTGTAKPATAPRRRPCNGPSCGRAPAAPLVPSEAPTASPDLDRAALISGLVAVPAATAGAWLTFDEPILIPAISGPPERPPRIA